MLAAILAIGLAAAPSAQTTAPSPTPATIPAQLRGAVQFDLVSKAGRSYRIYVSAPQLPPPPAGFPVLYVLDGDASFATASIQATLGLYDGRTPMVVVGIGYPDGDPLVRRNVDLTPSMPSGDSLTSIEQLFGPTKPGTYGDAEGYHRFLTEELRPIITQGFHGNPANQSLMGYSFGGLFALHVLFTHPESFENYLVGSPSIWWNDREVLKGESAFTALVKAGKVAPRILITSDQWEQFEGSPTQPPPGPERDKAIAQDNKDRMVDNARDLANRLSALKGSAGYQVHYNLFPEETHLTGMSAATSRGVAFIAVP